MSIRCDCSWSRDGRPYLHGWCLLREKKRIFRLDRVVSLEVLGVPSSPPADAEVLVGQGMFRPS